MFNAGDQVPAKPLFEVVGKAVKVVPGHTAATAVNVGTIAVLVNPPGAAQFELAPVKAKLFKVPLLLLPEESIAVVNPALAELAIP